MFLAKQNYGEKPGEIKILLCRMEDAKKRKLLGILVSLGEEYAETKNLYNSIGIIGGRTPESEILRSDVLCGN